MIIPDINLIVYAYNRAAPRHAEARRWWERLLNQEEPVGIPWAVVNGYVRLLTHRAVLVQPRTIDECLDAVESWFERPHVRPLDPGPRHLAHLRELLGAAGVAGNLVTDAHIAALAVEHRATIHSNDTDFQRFPGARVIDPLERE